VILVTGGTGQLGTAFRELLPGAAFPSRSRLDLSRPGDLAEQVARFHPTAVINCAAYTAVDRAEEEEDLATVVNGDAVGVLARCAAELRIPFVTFSSDYVFDGAARHPYVESSPTNPVNAYGRSKLAGEAAAFAAYPEALVVRTSWVISGTHPNFVATMLRLAAQRELSVVDDQHGCPTIASDLAGAVLDAMERRVAGVLHLVNAGTTTWFGLARTAVAEAGLDPARITACSTAEYPTAARRPAYSVLDSERLASLGLDPLPEWRTSLPGVVASLMERP
jgi:dTDP-4-dehydrorhamnose reductase